MDLTDSVVMQHIAVGIISEFLLNEIKSILPDHEVRCHG